MQLSFVFDPKDVTGDFLVPEELSSGIYRKSDLGGQVEESVAS